MVRICRYVAPTPAWPGAVWTVRAITQFRAGMLPNEAYSSG